MNGIQSEMLKYKRTFTKALIVLFPLFFALKAIPGIWLMPECIVRSCEHVVTMVFNIWTVAFLPLGIALFAYLAASQERKAGNYRELRAHDYSPTRIWINKVAVMAIHTFLSTLVLMAATIISGLITTTTGKWDIPLGTLLTSGIVTWIASLALIPIQLWAATWQGVFFSMGLGFAGMMCGVFAAAKSFWIFLPWSWGTRMMCPLIQVNPNGVMLESGDSLLDFSVVPIGLVISIIAFLVITVMTAVWFNRREVK